MTNQNQDKGPLYRTIQDDIDEAQVKQAMTSEQARQILEDAQRERLEQCQVELDALLKKYSVQLSTQIGVSQDGRIVANVVLVNAA